jgi:hypothetical protein
LPTSSGGNEFVHNRAIWPPAAPDLSLSDWIIGTNDDDDDDGYSWTPRQQQQLRPNDDACVGPHSSLVGYTAASCYDNEQQDTKQRQHPSARNVPVSIWKQQQQRNEGYSSDYVRVTDGYQQKHKQKHRMMSSFDVPSTIFTMKMKKKRQHQHRRSGSNKSQPLCKQPSSKSAGLLPSLMSTVA